MAEPNENTDEKYRINMVIKTQTLLVLIAFICFLCILQTNSKLTKQRWLTYFIFYFIFLGWEWDSGLFRWQWWNFCFGKMVDASNRSFGFIKSCHIHFVCHESNCWPGKHDIFNLYFDFRFDFQTGTTMNFFILLTKKSWQRFDKNLAYN